jgi:hypothetical protein
VCLWVDQNSILGPLDWTRMHLHGSVKIRVIEDWEEPRIVHEVRSFLGLDNYYHRFVEGYSKISTPLSDLLKKNKPWNWMEKC